MTKGKGKVKKVSLRERIIRWLGGVPAPKKRSGKGVNVRPYVRKAPAKVVEAAPAQTMPLV
jgi:hypothetical protein